MFEHLSLQREARENEKKYESIWKFVVEHHSSQRSYKKGVIKSSSCADLLLE